MNSDRVVHRTHRHEPPVKGVVQLVGETEDLMAVCKPASMPMHPWYGTSTSTSTTLYCVMYTTVHYTTLHTMYCSIDILHTNPLDLHSLLFCCMCRISGGYRYNSLSFILEHEPFSPNQPTLCGVHRLDRYMVRDSGVIIQYLTAVVLLLLCRVTSGLVIVAKNKKTAALISKEIRENSTQKVTFQSMLLY